MVRRLISIPLALILAIAVFSSSVAASTPENIVEGAYEAYVSNGTDKRTIRYTLDGVDFYDFKYGYTYGAAFSGASQLTYSLQLYVPSEYSTYDMYFPVLTSAVDSALFGNISEYYYSQGNITILSSLPFQFYDFVDNNSYQYTSIVEPISITYMCFRVSSGVYSIQPAFPNPATVGGSVGSYVVNPNTGVTNPAFVFGVYMSELGPVSDLILDKFENGELTYSEALDQINSSIDQSVSSAETTDDAILNVLVGQNRIEQLIQLSHDKTLESIQSSFRDIDSFLDFVLDGSMDLSTAITDISNIYDNLLSNASTPEEAQTIAAMYSIALKKAGLCFDRLRYDLDLQLKKMENESIDSAIPEEYIGLSDTYIQIEGQLFEMLDQEAFQAQIEYENWLYSLPTDEASLFKDFFDYLINESPFKFFVTVPMCLGLFSILLATRLSPFLRPRNRGD